MLCIAIIQRIWIQEWVEWYGCCASCVEQHEQSHHEADLGFCAKDSTDQKIRKTKKTE